MTLRLLYSSIVLLCLITISWMVPFEQELRTDKPERIKIALRQVGNQLLLADKDSTSIISPVVQLAPLKYQLSFERAFTFLPDSLVSILDNNFAKAGVSKNYIVEVLRCEDGEVTYSYEMNMNWDKTIVPCLGRQVPDTCYKIEIQFIEEPNPFSVQKILISLISGGLLIFVVLRFRETYVNSMLKSEDSILSKHGKDHEYTELGSFLFYPEQNKLVKEAHEMPLSPKECELLAIFVTRPNEVIKREELTKSVWEDNGVIVSRSLDTYISKLRKKLKGDSTIKITNVHGVGYRLEVNK